jgi:hypothetical protein
MSATKKPRLAWAAGGAEVMGVGSPCYLPTRACVANPRGRIGTVMRCLIENHRIAADAMSHNAIAAKLNERNVRTARGGAWTLLNAASVRYSSAQALS